MPNQRLVAAPLLPDSPLTGTTFTRWLRAITDAEAAKIRAQNAKILAETERDERWRQRRGRLLKLAADKRNQSVQAFWAMHVQTPNWNRMAFTHYVPADAGHQRSLTTSGRELPPAPSSH
jgi:hypothetical protein